MKLLDLTVEGFGTLIDRAFSFDPVLTVIVGPNEAGKSTLARAIVASLYGLRPMEKAIAEPWRAGRFGTRLRYSLSDGAVFEVHRDFERDAKGISVYDSAGKDISAAIGNGRVLSPGQAHLDLPIDVFINAAYAGQERVTIDGSHSREIAAVLSHALAGGPREDAAAGALKRIDEAAKLHVGSERANATKNAALRFAREAAQSAHIKAERARAENADLHTRRAELDRCVAEHGRLQRAHAETERRAQAMHAASLAARLEALRRIRDEFAALDEERARYDDVAHFPHGAMPPIEAGMREWQRLDDRAAECEAEQRRLEACNAELGPLDERQQRIAALSDAALDAMRAAAAEADEARAAAASAANAALNARRTGEKGSAFSGALAAIAAVGCIVSVGFAIGHLWLFAAIALCVGLLAGCLATARFYARSQRIKQAEALQGAADSATSRERNAASALGAIITEHHLSSVDDVVRDRAAARAVLANRATLEVSTQRASLARDLASASLHALEAALETIVDAPNISPLRTIERARALAARRSERDGIDARLKMISMQRDAQLGRDDEIALEREHAALREAGVTGVEGDGASLRLLEAERSDLSRRVHELTTEIAVRRVSLSQAELSIGDVAALDEQRLRCEAEVARLEHFRDALKLARDTIELRTAEAHSKFARRLEDYAATTVTEISGGRYREIKVDPASLELRVRVPETHGFVEIDRLSAGTREQMHLLVRFAMVRMFAEGLESPPLLLDDPFAFWDDVRLERCLPVLFRGARDHQTLLFTASDRLARAAVERGAARIDLETVTASPSIS